ncbi:MAG: hypothetical protein IPL65_05845 [Lewinellaceae bacterium]|nr:hypothetical protein [Lewinellaceae bacterium]
MPRQLLLLLFLFPIFLSAQTEYTLQDALDKEQIKLRVDGAGGHSGQSLVLHIERLAKRAIKVRIPAGLVFEPADTNLQALVVVKEELIALENPKVFFKVWGVCSEAHDRSPGEGDVFTPGELAAGALLKLTQYISDNKLYRDGDAQSAVWAVTDAYPIATIQHKGLLATTCQLLGQPLPEYKINTSAATRPARPREVAMQYEPLSVEGNFEYQTNTEKIINVYVIDSTGNKVRSIFENQRHPPGWAKYSFYFKTTKLPRGTYEVCLDDGEKIVKKIKVTY